MTRLVMKDSIEESMLAVRGARGTVESFKDVARALDPDKAEQKYLDFLEYLS